MRKAAWIMIILVAFVGCYSGPVLVAPEDGQIVAGDIVSFSWINDTTAQWYVFQLDTTPKFKTPAYVDAFCVAPDVDTFKYHHVFVMPPGIYWWKVTAQHSEGERSSKRSFVMQGPIAPGSVLDRR